MSSSDQEKPGGKTVRKKQKRSKKADQAQSPMPNQQQAAEELIDAAIAPAEASPAVAAAADTSPAEPAAAVDAPPVAEAAPAQAPSADTARPAETASSPVGLTTIATAYRDYTRKSIQDAQSYVEKLSSVRSLDKAVEVQTEFARQAYETFAADSQKICGLYGEYFRQALRLPRSPFDRPR